MSTAGDGRRAATSATTTTSTMTSPSTSMWRRRSRPARPPGPEAGALGSGVIIAPDGYVLTNTPVGGAAAESPIPLSDERPSAGRVVGGDARTDIALLKIDAPGLPAAALGDSDGLRVGDRVV